MLAVPGITREGRAVVERACRRGGGWATSFAVFALALLHGCPLRAATFTVTTTVDANDAAAGDRRCEVTVGAGDCSLRAAVEETNALAGPDAVILGAGRFPLTLLGSGEDASARGDLDVLDDLTLVGGGPASTIIDGSAVDDVLNVRGGQCLLAGFTIVSGTGNCTLCLDGGTTDARGLVVSVDRDVAVSLSARLRLTDSSISGGGVYVLSGTLALRRVTISGAGSGVRVYGGTSVLIEDASIVSNYTGLKREFGEVFVATRNVRFAGNDVGLELHSQVFGPFDPARVVMHRCEVVGSRLSGVRAFGGNLSLVSLPAEGMASRAIPYDHTEFGACSIAGEEATLPSAVGDFYFLIVGRCGTAESSYGRDSRGVERPSATTPCP